MSCAVRFHTKRCATLRIDEKLRLVLQHYLCSIDKHNGAMQKGSEKYLSLAVDHVFMLFSE